MPESNQTIMTRSRVRTQRGIKTPVTQKTIEKKRSVSEPEQVGDFTWEIGDTVKPPEMPDPGYTIVGEKGDYWLMEGPGGRYIDTIPKDIERTGGWIEWTPEPEALKKRYKRKSKSKRRKSKRRKSKRRKSKRRKSKPL